MGSIEMTDARDGLEIHGLKYLKGHGLDEAHLEVRAQNEGALQIYMSLGYEVIRASRFYMLRI